MAEHSPSAIVGWLRAHDTTDKLAGAAFLIGSDIMVTCAHVVRDHLGLPNPVSPDLPTAAITIRFEATQSEVVGNVLPGGWFSNARAGPGGLWDIAVVRLAKPVSISKRPMLAQWMPAERRPVLIHGAEAGYQSSGQQVAAEMAGSNLANGRRQIDPKDSSRGFTVVQGFSGGPVLDDLGNVVWGMIVAVDVAGRGVAHAIPAQDLLEALRSAGVEAEVRVPDRAIRKSDQEETQLSEIVPEAGSTAGLLVTPGTLSRDLDVRSTLVDSAKNETTESKLEELRRRMEGSFAIFAVAKRDAASAARLLGATLKLINAKGALEAFLRAATCEPSDFSTWMEICRLEQQAGTLDGAEKAASMALQAAVNDESAQAVALNELGNLHRARGNLSDALQAYERAHSISVRLAGGKA